MTGHPCRRSVWYHGLRGNHASWLWYRERTSQWSDHPQPCTVLTSKEGARLIRYTWGSLLVVASPGDLVPCGSGRGWSVVALAWL